MISYDNLLAAQNTCQNDVIGQHWDISTGHRLMSSKREDQQLMYFGRQRDDDVKMTSNQVQ